MKKIGRLTLLLLGVVLITISCEDDFAEAGSDLVNNNNFNALLYDASQLEVATKPLVKMQSNSLNSYSLGFYTDQVYGNYSASILTQLRLQNPDPGFGAYPELDSVVLSIPYYSKPISQDETGTQYKLDSIYGNVPINLELYRSNYFLRSEDPENDYAPQAYYSNQRDLFESYLDAQPFDTIVNFQPSAAEVRFRKVNSRGEFDTIVASPRTRIKLPLQYFKELIFDKEGQPELLSNSNFQNFFRGLYIKPVNTLETPITALSLLNLRSEEAKISLYFNTSDVQDPSDEELQQKEYELYFGSNIVNVFNTEDQTIPTGNEIYLKGGQGSMATIDLFTDPAELETLRASEWLINEANLTFYVDENQISEDHNQPQRLFVYDIKNNKVLQDYTFDISANDNNPLKSRLIHLGRLDKDNNGKRFYKLKLTSYVSDIINKDSTNTRLGLTVSNNVNIFNPLKAEVEGEENIEEGSQIEVIPSPILLTPQSTVLYGPDAPEANRLKLNIYYTEPN
ncbi:DUF4270 domain-containing protein [Mesonia ostreae]|uniref:DUF4270 domain-containing protein n=1 Tax=Mesonia ostreae TaxID=861110 RepID=A0ABU2KKN5_9FLAO|nr:DUF4270 domain-containing protein [Mesonia ostreae]MDT0295290.1 DUF4270 domain-containing protein [Mesonia ostreae]